VGVISGIDEENRRAGTAQRIDEGSPPGQPALLGLASAAGLDFAAIGRGHHDQEGSPSPGGRRTGPRESGGG
jgi:hypothetical protein